MNNPIKITLAASLALFIISCKCDFITCLGLDAQHSQWLAYQNGDILKFTNSVGMEIDFVVTTTKISSTKNLECSPNGLGGCNCPDCPTALSTQLAQTTDTSRKIVNTLGQTLIRFNTLKVSVLDDPQPGDTINLSYNIFDHTNNCNIFPIFKLNAKDSLLSSYTVGSRTYANVIVHQTDTTANLSANPIYNVFFVLRSYYNKQYGVIAFFDLKTQSLFYRKF